jgi:hypothetical protein
LVKEMLFEQYEQLRSLALGESFAQTHGLGLALFIHKGMTAWLEAWANHPPQMKPRSLMKPTAINLVADRLHIDVTMVLTNMVMSVGFKETDYDYAINSKGDEEPSQTECLPLCSSVYDETGIGTPREYQTSICSTTTG